MFFDLKRNYDNSIKDVELEIRDIESKILEQQFNLELIKNNSVINEKDKDEFKFEYSLKYNKDDFLPNVKIPTTQNSYDIPTDSSTGEQND
jgi:hypothetical protein